MSELYEKMAKELIVGNEAEVKKLTQEAIDGGAIPQETFWTMVYLPGWMLSVNGLKPVTCLSLKFFCAQGPCTGPWIFSNPCFPKVTGPGLERL